MSSGVAVQNYCLLVLWKSAMDKDVHFVSHGRHGSFEVEGVLACAIKQ